MDSSLYRLIEAYTGAVAFIGLMLAFYLGAVFVKKANGVRNGLAILLFGTGIAALAQVVDSIHYFLNGDLLIGTWRSPVTFTVLLVGMLVLYETFKKGKGNGT